MRDVVTQFSTAASQYDQYSGIQQRVFAQLVDMIPEGNYRQIVDIGSGTGAMTALLAKKYPDAAVVGVDAAPKMVMWAQQHYGNPRMHFVCSKMETVQFEMPPELLFSNATFQWMLHPEQALAHVVSQMAPGGQLAFSSFGPETYRELAGVIRHVWGHPVITSASQFCDGAALHAMFQQCCQDVVIKQYRYQRQFDGLADLLRSIKHTGTRGIPEGPKNWTPGLFREVERAYLAQYRHIRATYQVFYCTARRL